MNIDEFMANSVEDLNYMWVQFGPSFCQRCLESNRITHRAVSDAMSLPVCFNCALEAWKYTGPLGQIRLEVVG